MSQIKTAVLDGGHNIIKCKTASGDEISFVHALQEISESEYNRVGELNGAAGLPLDYIKINNRCFVVGENAESHGVVNHSSGPSRYSTDYLGVFALCALARLYSRSCEVNLFCSHPTYHINFTDDLLRSVVGVWDIESGGRKLQITVPYANVYDEPAGGLYNVMLTEDGKGYANAGFKQARVLVIDIGGGTTNFLVMLETGEIDYGLAHTESSGISSVIKDFERDFRRRYPDETRAAGYLQPDRVRAAIRDGLFRGGGRALDCKDEARAARAQLVNRILKIYQSTYGGGLNYDAILLTGGGSGLLYDAIAPHLQNDYVYPADDLDSIHFANVRGGLKLWRCYQDLGITS
jgi:hypothetical protein